MCKNYPRSEENNKKLYILYKNYTVVPGTHLVHLLDILQHALTLLLLRRYQEGTKNNLQQYIYFTLSSMDLQVLHPPSIYRLAILLTIV